MDTGLTTIDEKDIDKHRPTAQSMVTRVVVLQDSKGVSNTALAGTGRRFVSTVSTGPSRLVAASHSRPLTRRRGPPGSTAST